MLQDGDLTASWCGHSATLPLYKHITRIPDRKPFSLLLLRHTLQSAQHRLIISALMNSSVFYGTVYFTGNYLTPQGMNIKAATFVPLMNEWNNSTFKKSCHRCSTSHRYTQAHTKTHSKPQLITSLAAAHTLKEMESNWEIENHRIVSRIERQIQCKIEKNWVIGW